MQRLAGPDREPDSDQVDGAQRDGDRKPNRRFEGHGVILSTIWNRSTYTTRPTSAMFQQSTWPRTRAPDSYLWRRIPPDGVYERTRWRGCARPLGLTHFRSWISSAKIAS